MPKINLAFIVEFFQLLPYPNNFIHLKQPGGIVSNQEEPEMVIIAIFIIWIAGIEEIVSGV
jgi:hypothetical protein